MKAAIRIAREGVAPVDDRLFSSFIERMGRATKRRQAYVTPAAVLLESCSMALAYSTER